MIDCICYMCNVQYSMYLNGGPYYTPCVCEILQEIDIIFIMCLGGVLQSDWSVAMEWESILHVGVGGDS